MISSAQGQIVVYELLDDFRRPPVPSSGKLMNDTSTILTCPDCGRDQHVEMPTDYCVFFYDCKHCGAVLRPDKGDDCVFCSFADKDCPQNQTEST